VSAGLSDSEKAFRGTGAPSKSKAGAARAAATNRTMIIMGIFWSWDPFVPHSLRPVTSLVLIGAGRPRPGRLQAFSYILSG
jgi:hypothetical protein